jgi:pantothenate kinase-related protein Tda10
MNSIKPKVVEPIKDLSSTSLTRKPDEFEPLRMIVSGTAGSGKSFLIKCIVKAIRTILSSNKAVQVIVTMSNTTPTHEFH